MPAGESDLEAKSRHRDVLVVATAKTAVLGVVAWSGFTALSDDDYARLVLAQTFAARPSWDPSGTSWLPLPFWLDGTVLAALGPTVSVARGWCAVLGVASAVLVLAAARVAGVPRYGAVTGALIASCIPYAAWLGLATVPDGWTAALVTFAAASTASDRVSHRALGGAAIAAATLSRYEAWPVAAAFAACCAWDATRRRSAALAAVGAASVAGAAAWLVHGARHHGDALFFVARVSEYRRAVGATPGSPVADALWYPVALVRAEPELAVLAVAALVAATRAGVAGRLRVHARPALVLGAMVATLSASAVLGGAPTHHNERTLLAAWLLLAVVSGHAASAAWTAAAPRARWTALGAATAVGLLAATVARPWYARRDDFVDRRAEVDIGRRARAATATGHRVLVDTADFGYWAVLAGLARPGAAVPVDDRDPRRPGRPDAFSTEATLAERVRSEGATHLVARAEHAALAERLGPIEARNGRFVLARLEPDR